MNYGWRSLPQPLVVRHAGQSGALPSAAERDPFHLEWLFAATALFIFSGAVLPFLFDLDQSEPDPTVGNPSARVVFAAIYVVSAIFVAGRRRELFKHRAIVVPIGLILLYSASSWFWSQDPDLTVRRWIALLGTSVFGLQLGIRFTERERVQLIFAALASTVLVSLIFAVVTPLGRSDVYDGAINGAFSHKNEAGRAAALTLITGAVCFMYSSTARGRLSIATILLAATALLFGSRSATALLICLTTIVVVAVVWCARRRLALTVVALFVFSGVLVISVWGLTPHEVDRFLQSFGRDLTLTGRLDLWALLLDVSENHRAFGFGYAAFWRGDDGVSAYVWHLLPWEPPHAHNGYLDLMLELGWIGVVGTGLVFLQTITRVVRRFGRTSDPYAYWTVGCLWALAVLNLTESTVLHGNNLFTVIFLAIAFGDATRPAVPSSVPIKIAAQPKRRGSFLYDPVSPAIP